MYFCATKANTVYYYDVVDEYRWILTDYYQRLDTAATNVQKLTFYCVYDDLDLAKLQGKRIINWCKESSALT